MREQGGQVRVRIGGSLQTLRIPPGGIVIRLAGVERIVRTLLAPPADIRIERKR